MKTLNLEQVRAFLDVVELGSFSAAAERAGVSQPAVSLQVRQLERRLGVELFERVGRRVQPTLAGLQFLDHARDLIRLNEIALDEMSRVEGGALGRVRLGAGATACIHLLPPILKDLKRRYPALEITVTTGNASDCVRAVETNALDLALVTLPASGRALEVTPILKDELFAIAPRDMALPDRVSASDLASLPLIGFEPGGNTRRLVDQWFAEAGIAFKPMMSLGSDEAIKEMVGAGLGCAVLSSLAATSRMVGGVLAARPLDPPLYRTLALVVRGDKKLHRGLRETLAAFRTLSDAKGADARTAGGRER